MANDNNDVEIRITGSVDPSLAASTSAAKSAMYDLGSAAQAVTGQHLAMVQAVKSGQLSLDELKAALGSSAEAKKSFAIVTGILNEAQTAEAVTADKAAVSVTNLSRAEAQALASRLALTKQQFGDETAAAAATFAFQQRMTKQRIAEAAAEQVAIERAAAAEAAAYEKAAAEEAAQLERMATLRAQQAGSNFLNDVNAATGVTGGQTKSARESMAVFVAEQELAAQAAMETAKAEAAAAAAAEAEAAAQGRVVTAAVPLYAARQRLEGALAAANARLAAGTITEEQNAAVVAAATNTYNRKVEALLKAGQAIQLETGEIVANTEATAINTVVNDANAFSLENLGKKFASGRSAMELEAGTRAILTGNMGRLASATAVEATRLDLLKYALNPTTLSVVALGAAFGYLAYQEYAQAKAAESVAEAFALTNRAAIYTEEAVRQEIDELDAMPGVSRKAAQALVEFDATHADVNSRLAQAINQLIPEYVKAFGKDAPQALNKMKESLAEIEHSSPEEAIRQFEKLNRDFLNLKPAEAQAIEGMLELGDSIGAVNRILADLASNGGGHINDLDGQLAKAEKSLEDAKVVAAGLTQELRYAGTAASGVAIALAGANTKVAELEARVKQLQAMKSEPNQGEDPADAYAKSHATLLSLRDSALRAKDAVAELHREMEVRRKNNPDDAEVKDYYANQAKRDADLMHKMDPGDFKKTKGPGQVAVWTEELRAQEIAENDFFGDRIKAELDFWTKKVDMTKAGSKEQLEVQGKIYEAQKQLARQAYEDHIASLDEQITADKENWAAEQADWKSKIAYIELRFGDESKEYKEAYKGFEEAQRQHEHVMLQIQMDAAKEGLAELRNTLATNRSIREADAHQAESAINYKAEYSPNPLAKVQAAQQIAALNKQTALQNIKDMEDEHVAADQLLQDDINAAKKGTVEYQKAVDAKKLADVQFANQHRQLMDQMANQERADLQKVQQAWHGVVDPMVKTTGNQIMGLIKGTESWGQALENIGEQALSMVVDAIERMVEQWIVNLIVGRTAQAATAEAQVISNAAVAGSAGVASMAAAPFPIDLGAPAFGAAMMTDALGYAAMASLDTGTNYVPSDMVAQIHEGERIIPKADNAALMGALAQQSMTNNRGGDMHNDFGVHLYGDADKMDGRKIVRALEGAQTHFSRLLKGMHRNGHFSYASR